MPTTLTVSLSGEAEAWLTEGATAMRQDLSTYLSGLIERLAAASKTLDRSLDPIHRAFEESGMTDDELGDLLEDAKHAMRAERRGTVHHG